ncbi:methionine adenosyltransferase domain-containing protein [Desulfosoma caldarium]|uniref:methionine adenosyltransferase domain-containing protein n=1 Tax=Desulfosoma caldarium TaxID=610254 RepID=UPI001474ECDF|nr:methionine adenosyltransferase domain-containing protein [Desulfosoma caldarium]
MAKNIVWTGPEGKGEVPLADVVGVAEPASVMVDIFETGRIKESWITPFVRKTFNFRPYLRISKLKLLRPIFMETAASGLFGHTNSTFT